MTPLPTYPLTVRYPFRCECGALILVSVTITEPVTADDVGSTEGSKRECPECSRDHRFGLSARRC